MLVCGQRISLFQVLWFCCSVCQWFTKLWQIFVMRRYEDYSGWSRCPPLVNWMTKTLGRIIEKEISSPDICCGNVQFAMSSWISHTLVAAVLLFDPWTKQSFKNQALHSVNFGKMSTNFHVPSLNKCQLVSLIFKNTEWLS